MGRDADIGPFPREAIVLQGTVIDEPITKEGEGITDTGNHIIIS